MTGSNVYMFPSVDVMRKVAKERRAHAIDFISEYILIEAGAITVCDDKPSAKVYDIAEEAAKRKKD